VKESWASEANQKSYVTLNNIPQDFSFRSTASIIGEEGDPDNEKKKLSTNCFAVNSRCCALHSDQHTGNPKRWTKPNRIHRSTSPI
jgi:hypothetical protein